MSFAQLYSRQIINNVQRNSGLHLYLISNHTASSLANSAPNLMTSPACFFLFHSWPQSNVILLMRAAMEGVRLNIKTATTQDIMSARYLIARITKINSLNRLNSLATNPNLTILFLQFVTSPRIMSMLNTLPSILLERLAHSCKTHSEFRIFWWENYYNPPTIGVHPVYTGW